MFSESIRKPLSTSGFKVVEYPHGDTKLPGKHRETQPSLKEDPYLVKKLTGIPTSHTSTESSVRPQWGTLGLDSPFGKKGSDFANYLDPRDLSWSSSTAKTWNRLSPASFAGEWDLPDTPPRLSDTPSPGQTCTPLTPPTPPSPSLGRRSGSKTALKELKDSYFNDEIGLINMNSALEEKDDFRPKKLFRNHTLEFEKISKANAAVGKIKYNREPSFNFSSDEPQPISSRTRSKTSKDTTLLKPEDPSQASEASSVMLAHSVSGSELPSLLELVLPLDLHKRLGDDSGRCIGSMLSKSYERCGNRLKGSLRDATAITRKFVGYKAKKDYEAIVRGIEALVGKAMCGQHQNVVLAKTKQGVRIEKLREFLYDSQRMSEIDQQALYQWLDAIPNPKLATDHIPWVRRSTVPTIPPTLPYKPNEPTRSTHKEPQTVPNISRPNKKISSFANFTPFQLNRTKRLSVSDALLMQIQKPLGASEINPGFIYIFWDKRYFGKLKIGRTQNTARRLKEWNSKCGKKHSYLSQDDWNCVNMPHVGRVEALIHTELKECREKRMCEGCGTLHQEWFDEGEIHAVKVVRKWQDWMMQKPYVKNAMGQWVLRPGMVESLGQVCEPLARDKVVVKQARKSEGVQRPVRKKGGRKTM